MASAKEVLLVPQAGILLPLGPPRLPCLWAVQIGKRVIAGQGDFDQSVGVFAQDGPPAFIACHRAKRMKKCAGKYHWMSCGAMLTDRSANHCVVVVVKRVKHQR